MNYYLVSVLLKVYAVNLERGKEGLKAILSWEMSVSKKAAQKHVFFEFE